MQHVKLKHASDTGQFFQALVGLAVAALVMLGVGGSVYRLIAPGGWMAQLFERSVAGGLAALLAFALIALCVWLTRNLVSVSGRNRYAELFVYVFAGAGLLYAAEILMKGGA